MDHIFRQESKAFRSFFLQPPLPKVVWHSEDEDDYEDDDEDENFIAHAHAMTDELDFTLTEESEMDALRKPNKN